MKKNRKVTAKLFALITALDLALFAYFHKDDFLLAALSNAAFAWFFWTLDTEETK